MAGGWDAERERVSRCGEPALRRARAGTCSALRCGSRAVYSGTVRCRPVFEDEAISRPFPVSGSEARGEAATVALSSVDRGDATGGAWEKLASGTERRWFWRKICSSGTLPLFVFKLFVFHKLR